MIIELNSCTISKRIIIIFGNSTNVARAGLRHAVVCPNMTGGTKGSIVPSKRAYAGSFSIVDQPQGARTSILRVSFLMPYCLSLAPRLFWPFVFFVESAALHSIVVRIYASRQLDRVN